MAKKTTRRPKRTRRNRLQIIRDQIRALEVKAVELEKGEEKKAKAVELIKKYGLTWADFARAFKQEGTGSRRTRRAKLKDAA